MDYYLLAVSPGAPGRGVSPVTYALFIFLLLLVSVHGMGHYSQNRTICKIPDDPICSYQFPCSRRSWDVVACPGGLLLGSTASAVSQALCLLNNS